MKRVNPICMNILYLLQDTIKMKYHFCHGICITTARLRVYDHDTHF